MTEAAGTIDMTITDGENHFRFGVNPPGRWWRRSSHFCFLRQIALS